ncbi:MAG: hypothetical protein HC767_11250 [Akkermansiaceae bacterium]|nr:hypothetical protein [Akkermansiaceae bacterium]
MNSQANDSPQKNDPPSSQGRRRPIRLTVRSLSWPMPGSMQASNSFEEKSSAPATQGSIFTNVTRKKSRPMDTPLSIVVVAKAPRPQQAAMRTGTGSVLTRRLYWSC